MNPQGGLVDCTCLAYGKATTILCYILVTIFIRLH
jgi:hypothetical protein